MGIIGSRVADCLRRRGFHVFVWNRTPRPYPNFVGSASEVADLCDFVQIFVSDDDALMEMVQQMRRSLSPHHVVMAHSTVAPYTMRAAAEVVQRRGAHFLDAPFTGSKLAAEKGELVYYVAGDAAAFRRARPALEASSKEIIEIGEIGQATTIKVATNMVTAATVQAASEALALVHESGLPVEKFAAAMRGNASTSPTLAMKLPKMMEGDFEPHFSVKHMLKDVQIAARLGRSHGLSFGATEAARDSLRREAERGGADYDYSAMSRAFFPERAPLQAPQESAAEEEQTLDLAESPAAEEGANGVEVEAVAEEQPAADEKSARSEAEEVTAETSGEVTTEPETKPEGSLEEQQEPSSPSVEAAGENKQEPSPEAKAEGDETPGAGQAPPELAAEAEPSRAEESQPDARDERDGETEEPSPGAAETSPPAEETPQQDFRLNATPDEESRTAEPMVTGRAAIPANDETPAEERRGFFGRMFGRGGDQ